MFKSINLVGIISGFLEENESYIVFTNVNNIMVDDFIQNALERSRELVTTSGPLLHVREQRRKELLNLITNKRYAGQRH